VLTWKGRCAIIYFAAQRPAGNRGTGGLKIQRTGGISMSTYMAKKGEVERKWYVIDAAGKPLGRVAAQAATLLRGKNKPTFTPHVDCGDHVIIINCTDVVLTGKKLTQKYYYRHTGYIGHLKATRYDTLMAQKPEKAMELAVKGMIPSNTIGRAAMLRLKVYAGSEHKHQAQKPEILD
jgi:large subunit ribosomal protein L13